MGGVFQHIAIRSRLEGGQNILLSAVYGENKDLGLRTLFLDLLNGAHPAHSGHGKVHQDEMWLESFRVTKSFKPVLRLRHHLERRIGGQQHSQPFAEDGMVLSDHNPLFLSHKRLHTAARVSGKAFSSIYDTGSMVLACPIVILPLPYHALLSQAFPSGPGEYSW